MRFIVIAIILFLVSILLACASSGATSNSTAGIEFRLLHESDLKRPWWLMSRDNSCVELNPIRDGVDDGAYKINRMHPYFLLRAYEGCLPKYYTNIDLLQMDCTATRLKLIFVYSTDKTACLRHAENFYRSQIQ